MLDSKHMKFFGGFNCDWFKAYLLDGNTLVILCYLLFCSLGQFISDEEVIQLLRLILELKLLCFYFTLAL
jgi:hypothetical protein